MKDTVRINQMKKGNLRDREINKKRRKKKGNLQQGRGGVIKGKKLS